MKCPKCDIENCVKWGHNRNNVQMWHCKSCKNSKGGKFLFPDPVEQQKWEKNRKRAPNKKYNKNELDELIVYLILKFLRGSKAINGIGSSRSIAALIERPHQTVAYWKKKYSNRQNKPNITATRAQLREYFKPTTKIFGRAIFEFLSYVLPYGWLPEIDEQKKLHKESYEKVLEYNQKLGAERVARYEKQQAEKSAIEKLPWEE